MQRMVSLGAVLIAFLLTYIFYGRNSGDTSVLYWNKDALNGQFDDVIMSALAIILAVCGTIAASAISLVARHSYKEVGLFRLIKRTISSTDFALSVLLFPFLFLVVVEAVLKSEDLLLTLMFSFETGFVIKTFMDGFGKSRA